VEGAIAFYLKHREEVDKVIEERKRAEEAYFAANPNPPEVRAVFERMHREAASRRK